MAAIGCVAALLAAACGPSDTATTSRRASPYMTTTSAQPTRTLSDTQIVAEARTFLLSQYGLGPDQQFRDIPQEGPGSGDWAARIDHITYVHDSYELYVFMLVTPGAKDTALDAAHSIALMIRQDPPLQQNVHSVRVGDQAGDELAWQDVCPLSVSDNSCQPAVWLR